MTILDDQTNHVKQWSDVNYFFMNKRDLVVVLSESSSFFEVFWYVFMLLLWATQSPKGNMNSWIKEEVILPLKNQINKSKW